MATGGGGSGHGGSAASFAAACEDFATTGCAGVAQCMPVLYTSVLGGAASCVARVEELCENGLSGGGIAIAPAQFQACVDALGLDVGSCSNVVRYVAGQWVPDACKVAGTRADGEPCVDGRQCAGRGCRVSANETCGACYTRAAMGGTCTVDADCDTGLFCWGATCTPWADEGAPCGGFAATCYADLFCNGNAGCTPRHLEGQLCIAQLGDCAADLQCTGQCSSIPLAGEGQLCGSDTTGLVYCAAGLSCQVLAPDATTGSCTAQGAEGGECPFDLWVGPAGPCPFPSTCIGGTCTALSGAACP